MPPESLSKSISKFGALTLAVLVFLQLGYSVQFECAYIGFPDSYLTEYDRAREPLYRVWYTLNYLWGFLTVALVVRSREKFWKRLGWSVGLFAFCQLTFWGYDSHLFRVLEHGQGGCGLGCGLQNSAPWFKRGAALGFDRGAGCGPG